MDYYLFDEMCVSVLGDPRPKIIDFGEKIIYEPRKLSQRDGSEDQIGPHGVYVRHLEKYARLSAFRSHAMMMGRALLEGRIDRESDVAGENLSRMVSGFFDIAYANRQMGAVFAYGWSVYASLPLSQDLRDQMLTIIGRAQYLHDQVGKEAWEAAQYLSDFTKERYGGRVVN